MYVARVHWCAGKSDQWNTISEHLLGHRDRIHYILQPVSDAVCLQFIQIVIGTDRITEYRSL
jgi:hypothetical protein